MTGAEDDEYKSPLAIDADVRGPRAVRCRLLEPWTRVPQVPALSDWAARTPPSAGPKLAGSATPHSPRAVPLSALVTTGAYSGAAVADQAPVVQRA